MLVIVAALGAACALILLLLALRSSMATVANSVQGLFSSTLSGITEDSGDGGEGTPAPAKTAFAVYSADDGSLDFYKRVTVPKVGDSFQGKIVTEVYTGFETENPGIDSYRRGYFHDREDEIRTISVIDTGIKPISTYGWFSEMSNLQSFDIKNLDLSLCTQMVYMFYACTSLESADLSNLYTPQLISIGGIFEACTSLQQVNVDYWYAPDLVDIWFAFYHNAFSSLDLTTFTASPQNFHAMFAGNANLISIKMGERFQGCNATYTQNMFSGCRCLTSIDLSCFAGCQSLDSNHMFQSCNSLHSIRGLDGIDFSKCSKSDLMFAFCNSLEFIELSGFDSSSLFSASDMFYGCSSLQYIKTGAQWVWPSEAQLPSPSSSISGADGKWYALSDGSGYAPSDVPSGVADTYYATKALRDAAARGA